MKKLFSIIMCVLMVMCFMPTLAFAGSEDDGTQVTYSPVYVMNSAGTSVKLENNQCLASISDEQATAYTDVTTYVAKYVGGKLYLKNYNINVTTNNTDVPVYAIGGINYEIVVESDSTITLKKNAGSYETIGIYGSKVNISGNGTLSLNIESTVERSSAYGIYGGNSLVATAPLNINVKGPVGGWATGIYVYSGSMTLSGGDKVINATGANTDEACGNAYGIQNYTSSYGTSEDNGEINIACNLKMETGEGIISTGITTDGDININGANVTISSSIMEKGMETTNGDIKICNNSKVDVNLANDYGNGMLAGNIYPVDKDGNKVEIKTAEDFASIKAYLFDGRGTLGIENSTVNVSSGSWSAKVKNVDIKNSDASFTTTYQYESPILTKDDTANYIDLSGYGRVTLKSCDYQYNTIDKKKFKEEFGEDPKPAYTAGLLNHVKLGSYTYVQTGTTDSNAIEGAVRILGTVTNEKEPTVTTAVISHLVRHSSSSAITELEKAKAEAKTEVKAKAEANKYDETEATEVKNIKDQADKDITAAKTVEEVNKIKAEAEAKIDAVNTAEENAEIKTISGIDKQVFKAKSKKTTLHGKKAIKVTWKLPSGISVDGFEVYRSTKRYSGFGTEPYFTTTKTSYTNNKDLKSGKTYYYKVRGYKMINGEKVYTGWSTKAYRTI